MKASRETTSITISNLENRETLCYSLVLVKGNVSNAKAQLDKLTLSSLSKTSTSSEYDKLSEWPVHNSEFKCIVNLRRGQNDFLLEHSGDRLQFTLFYSPKKTTLSVIPVYIICQGHDGRFQAPPGTDNSINSATERITVGAKLIQSLTAEKMYEAQVGRKTFQLENDVDPSAPDCVTFHSELPVEKARKMCPQELWEYFGRELMMSSLGSNTRKFLAFLSCTYYNLSASLQDVKSHGDVLSATEAHVALGGGGLALFGTACLYTWAKSVEDIVPSFLNKTKVDSRFFMDDSCYRGTYGGCYSTTLGSVTHELGHTFDLGHTSNGIMGRGFDDVDLLFTTEAVTDRQNMNVENGNFVKPVCKDVPVHTTVHFSKELNVSYSVRSPVKLPSNKSRASNQFKPGNQSGYRTEGKTITDLNRNRADDLTTAGKQKLDNNPTLPSAVMQPPAKSNDGIFWSRSCAVLLAYHRWFNNFTEDEGKIEIDLSKNLIHSTAGIRVVEARDESGLVTNHWEFLDTVLKYSFSPPAEILKSSHTIVAEDSVGNILKRCLA